MSYKLPLKPAGSDNLSCEIYSEHHIDKSALEALRRLLTEGFEKKVNVLIIGGRCGLSAEIYLPFSQQIDIVEEEPFLELLEQRFLKGKQVEYFFGEEGFLGETHLWKAPTIKDTKVNVIKAEHFTDKSLKSYDIVLLQNCLVNEKTNMVEELMKVDHQFMISMIVPGRILSNQHLFTFISRIQKNILMQYYNNVAYERIQNAKSITGRRQEIFYYEVFRWQRKTQKGREDQNNEIRKIIEEELAHFTIQSKKPVEGNPYESLQLLNMYLDFHFGEVDHFEIANYPKVCGQISIEIAKKYGVKGKALDIGCAVGRSTIEMANYFEHVVGVDLSKSFIQGANDVLHKRYPAKIGKVRFQVADACNLNKSLGTFNLIFGGNLIDRLQEPSAFLSHVNQFLEPNGILILTSPYTWLEEYTPKEKWIGGFIQNQKPVTTNQGLKRILEEKKFKELKENQNITFVIKENHWVYQYTKANATFWQKSN